MSDEGPAVSVPRISHMVAASPAAPPTCAGISDTLVAAWPASSRSTFVAATAK